MPYRASAVLPSTSPSGARFGRCAIHGALATSPARYSLTIDVRCQSSKYISQQSQGQNQNQNQNQTLKIRAQA